MIQGTRHDRLDGSIFQPGEYGKANNSKFYCCAPGNSHMSGNLSSHSVIEHDDGTITVSPSILITSHSKGTKEQWHGYLEKGVWREC